MPKKMFSQKSHSNPSFFAANADQEISEAYGDSSFKNIEEAEMCESLGNHDQDIQMDFQPSPPKKMISNASKMIEFGGKKIA
jgi:hypothetical protein